MRELKAKETWRDIAKNKPKIKRVLQHNIHAFQKSLENLLLCQDDNLLTS